MRRNLHPLAVVLGVPLVVAGIVVPCPAASTINASNRCAYAANAGWLDARADATNGVVIGEYVCSGWLYGANIGWISLGGGSPTNGIYYTNNSATDWGVNHLGGGKLGGFAFGPNIGWVNFEDTGNPRFDLRTGVMNGYAYGANIGWIGLSNTSAFVQTDAMAPGADSDGDQIPDAWERLHGTNLTSYSASTDADGDRVSDRDEYAADTDPQNQLERLEVTALGARTVSSTRDITWSARPTRLYRVDINSNLLAGAWTDSGLGLQLPDAGSPSTTRTVEDGALTSRYYRVKAVRPLAP